MKLKKKINCKKDLKIEIKRIRIKFDIKIKWDQMLRDEIEKKSIKNDLK
jgi:hypothetical protein